MSERRPPLESFISYKIRPILEETHSLITHTNFLQNFFTIISTCDYKGGGLLFIDLGALENEKRG